MSIKKERGCGFNLICDLCGDSISAASWEEAKAVKSLYGWASRKPDGKWLDVCKYCLHPNGRKSPMR